jgi:hypothetical protein
MIVGANGGGAGRGAGRGGRCHKCVCTVIVVVSRSGAAPTMGLQSALSNRMKMVRNAVAESNQRCAVCAFIARLYLGVGYLRKKTDGDLL